MVDFDKIIGLLTQAQTERDDLRHQFDQQRVELHQARNRLQREQDRTRGLEDQVADLELRLEQEKANRANAVQATLAHSSRTS